MFKAFEFVTEQAFERVPADQTKLLWEPVHTNFRVNADWRGSSPEVVFVGEVVGAEIGLIERLSCTS